MELRHLEYFLQLAKYEHVSQTADFLNISQPSLSKIISSLESDLGVKLFDHKGNRIQLNENGVRYAEYVKKAIDLLHEGSMYAKSTMYETLGDISILCHCFAPIMANCANEYSRLNPLTRFRISQAHNDDEIRNLNDYDFLLRAGSEDTFVDQQDQFWVTQPLATEEFILVFAPQFRDLPAEQTTVDLADFADAPFVTMYGHNVFFSDITVDLCQNAGYFPRIYCQVNDFLLKVNIVSAGNSVAFIPESCLPTAEQLCPGLRHFSLRGASTRRTISLMRKRKAMMSEVAQDFWNFVMDYYGLEGNLEK